MTSSDPKGVDFTHLPSSSSASQAAPESVKPAASPKPTNGRSPAKSPGWLIVTLRVLMGILILFGLGAVLVIFTLYIPQRDELSAANQKIAQISSQCSTDLGNARQEIERLTALNTQNSARLSESQVQLSGTDLHVALLQARLDVTTAQLALVNQAPEKAKAALAKTADVIKSMESLLPSEKSQVAKELLTRLQLALDGIDANQFAARSDLDVMLNTLLELEQLP